MPYHQLPLPLATDPQPDPDRYRCQFENARGRCQAQRVFGHDRWCVWHRATGGRSWAGPPLDNGERAAI